MRRKGGRRLVAAVAVGMAAVALGGVVSVGPAQAEPNPTAIIQGTFSQQDLIFTLGLGDGGREQVGNTGLEPATQGFTFCPDGTLYGLNQSEGAVLVALDSATGAGTVVGPLGTGTNGQLACDGNGRLFFVQSGGSLYIVDRDTGEAGDLGDLGIDTVVGAAADCTGRLLITAGGAGGTSLYELTDPEANTTPELIGALGINGARGIAFDTDGELWLLRTPNPNPAETYVIDVETGAAELVNGNVNAIGASGLAIAPLDCPDQPPGGGGGGGGGNGGGGGGGNGGGGTGGTGGTGGGTPPTTPPAPTPATPVPGTPNYTG